MIQPVHLYGEPVLNEVSVDVDRSYPRLQQLVSDMYETMHKAQGMSLCAAQVGYPVRVFVVEAHVPEQDLEVRESFVNPEVIREFGEPAKLYEGCLSTPGAVVTLERPSKIELRYFDEKWKEKRQVFEGYAARLVQHELDHLDGTMHVDKLDTLWRATVDPILEKVRNKDLTVPYHHK